MKYKGITKDSRLVKPGFVYFCFDGDKVSGYDFIDKAIENGASKIVGEKDINIGSYERVANVNLSMIEHAKEIYDNPQNDLNLIGVTGTDGKTSTALIIDQFLNHLTKSSYLGTNGFFIGQEEMEYTGFTTPFADELYRNLDLARSKKSSNFVMEVSSHALEQNRLGDLIFKVVLFTNLTPEHLDFHPTLEDYYNAKKKLMFKTNKNSTLVINIDDDYGVKLVEDLKDIEGKIVTVGKNDKADFQILDIQSNLSGTIFSFIDPNNNEYKITSSLLGDFNVYNLLQAMISVSSLGYKLEEIIELIPTLSIPGRMERIQVDDSPNVIIDFAHTANAIEKVVGFIKPLHRKKNPTGKLITVTGSAGDRDQEKRPSMGRAATNGVDVFYLTEDDPRDEDPAEINKQIKSGISNDLCEVYEENDRKKLIKDIVKKYNSNDTVIFFGKGEMKVMYYDGYTEPYYEKDEINKAIVTRMEK